MYKILNDHVAVPAVSVDLVLSSRPSRGVNANSQKLVTVRSFTENYRQFYSIRTARDWNALPHAQLPPSRCRSSVAVSPFCRCKIPL